VPEILSSQVRQLNVAADRSAHPPATRWGDDAAQPSDADPAIGETIRSAQGTGAGHCRCGLDLGDEPGRCR